MMNARLNKAVFALLAVAAAGACDDPPIEPGNTDAERLVTNPSFVVIEAGETRLVQAYLANALGNAVSGEVQFEACDADITVSADENQTDIEPGNNFIIEGVTLGESCVNVSGGGFEQTIQVRVVPAEVVATAVTDTVRAGDAGSIDVMLADATGASVGPFAETDATFESDNEDVLFFTDEAGSFDTHEAGTATVTVTYESFGVERTLEIPVTVLPGLPESGEFTEDLGPALAGDTASAAVVLYDSIGNENNLASDIDSVVVESSDETIATAYAVVEPVDGLDGRVEMTVYAVAVGGGQADISATAYTVNGAIDLGSSQITVVAPVNIATILPADAGPGEAVVIAGTNLVQVGSETTVIIDGEDVTEFVTAMTPTAITIEYPGAGEARDMDVTVDVGAGATTDTETYSFGGEANEPANNSFALSAPLVSIPSTINGWFGYNDEDDYYRIVPGSDGTLTIDMDWSNDDLDLDAYVYDVAAGGYICTSSASGAKPEASSCALTSGNTYILIINDYSLTADGISTPVEYTLDLGF